MQRSTNRRRPRIPAGRIIRVSAVLNCWKCGAGLDGLPVPLGRRDECPACGADLHVCRMCEFYDTSVAKSCREPIAEEVTDKERCNFCDYFRARPSAHDSAAAAAGDAARAELEALFGVQRSNDGASSTTDAKSLADKRRAEADDARRKLDALFGDDEKS